MDTDEPVADVDRRRLGVEERVDGEEPRDRDREGRTVPGQGGRDLELRVVDAVVDPAVDLEDRLRELLDRRGERLDYCPGWHSA